MAHKFRPENWERLLSAERRALLDPEEFLRRLGISPGETVADLGAGPGFFTDHLAQQVGPSGLVYALDVAPEMVALLRRRALPPNVVVLQSQESKLPLPDASVDLAMLAFVLHELEHPRDFLIEARRILKPGGRLLVLEWVPQQEEMGPPLHERLAPTASTALLASAGWALSSEGAANPSNYYQVYQPVSRPAQDEPPP